MKINVLSRETIDQIAAGEVVERPSSIVKELTENAIDAGANAVTIQIEGGGIDLIRITDNGEGIAEDEIRTAFLRHATSKIKSIEDLHTIASLGFRGEALSSISAVSQVEVITRCPGSILGTRYCIEGGEEKCLEQIGAPEGSTFIIRNLFYNTPARKKFLKSAVTEAGYISELTEHMALSNPSVSFKLIVNGQTKLHTSGNGKVRDIIYTLYGRETVNGLLPVSLETEQLRVEGFIGRPSINRGNRKLEQYYVNGRYIRSTLLSKAIEDGYEGYIMQHRYPFTMLQITVPGDRIDVNVHPAKMEVRFSDMQEVYNQLHAMVREALSRRDLVTPASVMTEKEQRREAMEERRRVKAAAQAAPEPFEQIRKTFFDRVQDSVYEPKYPSRTYPDVFGEKKHDNAGMAEISAQEKDGLSMQDMPRRMQILKKAVIRAGETADNDQIPETQKAAEIQPKGDGQTSSQMQPQADGQTSAAVQMSLFDDDLSAEAQTGVPPYRIVGEVFDTYWIVQLGDQMYMIDQHAAHEKVMYERLTAMMEKKEATTQQIIPPIVISLSMQEEEILRASMEAFAGVGYEIEHSGGRDYVIRGVPGNMYGFDDLTLFTQMLDTLADGSSSPDLSIVYEKLASMSCKAAVKGGRRLSRTEAEALIRELLSLKQPFHCPHGRPTIIVMSRYEIEKKFKRVL